MLSMPACDEEGGLCRTAAICPGWNSACDRSSCPCGRPAGKKSRAGAGKPGRPSQANKRRKIVETKRHDSRWKRWSGVGGGIEQGGEPTAVAEFRRRVGYCPNAAPLPSLQDRHDGGDAFTQGAYCSVLLWYNCLYWDVLL